MYEKPDEIQFSKGIGGVVGYKGHNRVRIIVVKELHRDELMTGRDERVVGKLPQTKDVWKNLMKTHYLVG